MSGESSSIAYPSPPVRERDGERAAVEDSAVPFNFSIATIASCSRFIVTNPMLVRPLRSTTMRTSLTTQLLKCSYSSGSLVSNLRLQTNSFISA